MLCSIPDEEEAEEEAEEEGEEGEAAGEEAEDVGFDETEAVKQELRQMATEELVGFLRERGADTSGAHEDLVERLAELFAPELDR